MFWNEELRQHLFQRVDDGALTHAVMLAGPPGMGKRALATQLLGRFLGVSLDASAESPAHQHPDLHVVRPEEDKRQIAVDQIRGLTAALALSAHGNQGKAALIEPADSMTSAAANSLLKTLEEPTADSLLVLVVDGRGRLPATILSRTTRYQTHPPARSAAVAWLAEQGLSEEDAAASLALADGAPFRALELAQGDGLALARQIHDDVAALMTSQRSALEVAAQWRKLPHEDVLAALRRVTMGLVYARMSPKLSAASDFQRYVVDTRDAFCYLDGLNRLIARLPGTYNPELAIDAMAMPWANRLAGARQGLTFG
ncbi:MAG: hypothetical protein AAF545_08675 [Pseudomonadota bacterium]